MAGTNYGAQKHEKELRRAERRTEKAERRAQRRFEKVSGHVSPEDPSAGMAEPYSVEEDERSSPVVGVARTLSRGI